MFITNFLEKQLFTSISPRDSREPPYNFDERQLIRRGHPKDKASRMEAKIKHLDFIQGVINRLSTNSFLLKGWSVVLISALVALGSQNASNNYIYLALLPGFIFWGLDGYFLWQERLYRKLYDYVRGKEDTSIDFCMSTKPVLKNVKGWRNAVISPTLSIFHSVLILSIFVVMYFESR